MQHTCAIAFCRLIIITSSLFILFGILATTHTLAPDTFNNLYVEGESPLGAIVGAASVCTACVTGIIIVVAMTVLCYENPFFFIFNRTKIEIGFAYIVLYLIF